METVGDCWVSVTGFPNAQSDHAIRHVRFALDCVSLVSKLTQSLERTLGPGTADLTMRFGMHSGPVTAGVLDGGDNPRLQLFGDTINTASRMETFGEAQRIHVSQATADLLVEGGRRNILEPRKSTIEMKGKGNVQTYWIKRRNNGHRSKRKASNSVDSTTDGSDSAWSDSENESFGLSQFSELEEVEIHDSPADGDDRLVEWHVDWMTKSLQTIVARRMKKNETRAKFLGRRSHQAPLRPEVFSLETNAATPLEEVLEVITLPKFDEYSAPTLSEISAVKVPETVTTQLRHLVKAIADMYHKNPFHNFAHASHVTGSVHKLLNRVVNPEQVVYEDRSARKIASDLHDHTFGLTSDPLTHFAIVFSALIHDVDHPGVSNGQLSVEKKELAEHYHFKSIAEQNSVDLAWDLFTQDQYKELHNYLFGDENDFVRFRQLVVNVVLATDIFDKELKELRNLRWDKAFNPDKYLDDSSSNDATESIESTLSLSTGGSNHKDRQNNKLSKQPKNRDAFSTNKHRRGTNRRATIVIEHVIQASDVAHTMQHWNVYTKWNEKLFQEMYLAYNHGRSQSDPSTGWYKGELWFFDNYVIPLAKKLADCGVFGVAADECLMNAIENRKEWAIKGEQIVQEMLQRARKAPIYQESTFIEEEESSVSS